MITMEGPSRATRPRLAYLDSLRAAVIAMVIVHHAGLPYGPVAANAWPVSDAKHAAVLGTFAGVNASFGMALLFLISGCVVPDAFERHGAAAFVRTRVRRLGVPLAVFSMVMLVPGIVFQFIREGRPLASFPGHLARTLIGEQHFGHLWYLAVLLVFAVLYAGWRVVAPREVRPTRLPGAIATLGFLAALTATTFAVRIWFPLDRWVAILWLVPVEPAHLPQYIGWFVLGAVARRRGWLEAVSSRRGMAWLAVGIAAAAACYVWPLWAGGGATLAALRWAGWESVICTGMCVGLLVLFRDRCAVPGRLARLAAPEAYATYIFHIPVVLGLQLAIAHTAWPPAGKFGFVAALGVPLSFLVAAAARRWRPLRAML
jgi:peptidoglycan/LPS O-acetylase OafA/YrhL